MKIKKPTSIRTRLPLMFILMVLIPTILVSAIFSKIELEGGRERILNQLKSVVTLKQSAINIWVRSLKADLDSALASENIKWHATVVLSKSPSMELLFDTSYSKIDLSFRKLLQQTRRFNTILLMNLEGEVIYSTLPELEDMVFLDHDFFNKGRDAFFIHPASKLLSTEEWSIVASQPVLDDKDSLVGIVAGIATMDRLIEIMSERSGLGQTGETYLMGQNLILLTGSRFRKERYFSLEIEGAHKAMSSEDLGLGLYNDYREQPVVGYHHHIEELGVVLLAKQDQSEAFQSTHKALRFMFIVAFFVMCIAVWVGVAFTRRITTPLTELVCAAKQVRAGNWDVPLNITSGDEIGNLAKAFNLMKGTIKESFVKIQNQNVELTDAHKELEDANSKLEDNAKTLQQKVKERTKELNTSLEQLASQHSQLKVAKEAAEDANRAKSTFLANMSHELRTPLNSIIGFSNIIARNPDIPSSEQENLGIIQRNGEHLLTLINQVLSLSKIEAEHITLDEVDFDLHKMLKDIFGMFESKAQEKDLEFLLQLHDTVPRYIRSDEVRLRQVLINLLDNAVKFTEVGGVTLEVKCEQPKAAAGTHGENLGHSFQTFYFIITDTGAGIAPKEMDRLFEAFGQTATGRHTFQGTGLGLPISRKFVQLLGGDINIESELGKGSVFSFEIQAREADASDIEQPDPARRAIALQPGQTRYRILVADDIPDNRQLLVKLLQPFGFDLREAGNGQEACEIVEAWAPHLIWMDIRMPVMDGLEATDKIQALSSPKSMPVIIAVTASVFEEKKAQVRSSGCDDFLPKPFTDTDVFELLRKHLDVRFVYEEDQTQRDKKRQNTDKNEVSPEALAALHVEWLETLRQGARQADIHVLENVIEQIRGQDWELAGALAKLVDEFNYNEIAALLAKLDEDASS